MQPNINRSAIPCWFETQPAGCRKPHCVFQHNKPRPSINELHSKRSEWILPVGQKANISSSSNNDSSQKMSSLTAQDEKKSMSIAEIPSNEPIQINLEKDDDSDDPEHSELDQQDIDSKLKVPTIEPIEQIKMERVFAANAQSISNPNRKHGCRIVQQKNNQKFSPLTSSKQDVEINKSVANRKTNKSVSEKEELKTDFVVKTLEQIRQERVESSDISTNKIDNDYQSNDNQFKENEAPKSITCKRPSSDLPTRPIKLRRNKTNTDVCLQSQANKEGVGDSVDEKEIDSPKISETKISPSPTINNSSSKLFTLDFEFLDDQSVDFDSSIANNNESANIDDDELMRQIDQVINS